MSPGNRGFGLPSSLASSRFRTIDREPLDLASPRILFSFFLDDLRLMCVLFKSCGCFRASPSLPRKLSSEYACPNAAFAESRCHSQYSNARWHGRGCVWLVLLSLGFIKKHLNCVSSSYFTVKQSFLVYMLPRPACPLRSNLTLETRCS